MIEIRVGGSRETARRLFLVAFVVAVALASPVLTGCVVGGPVGGVAGTSTPPATLGAPPTSASPVPLEASSAAPLAGSPTSLVPVPSAGASITVRDVPLHLAGPRPSVWGPGDMPPGAPFAPPRSAQVHDQPTASFFSPLPGSGGNVTWNATLPQDRSATANQSDLYAAAWFGLVVSDPAAWLGQCYVELQLYPDFNWSSPTTTVAGDWSGAIVGWQIDPTSGDIDTCYYTQLYLHGNPSDGFFSMREGDTFSVTLRGYASDSAGENVSIRDTNSTAVSTYDLFNTTGNIPLNPAYPTNEFQNALLWSSGGQLPITFGFEIGREGNPGGVHNSTFQGCTPGPFSPSRADPSTPCPSYDPLSWVNDTLTPWEFGIPTFGGHRSPRPQRSASPPPWRGDPRFSRPATGPASTGSAAPTARTPGSATPAPARPSRSARRTTRASRTISARRANTRRWRPLI